MTKEAIDYKHLNTYTSGDTNLQREVLRMYVQQTDQYLRALKESEEHEGWNAAAHALKGSSRGIGAWKVAEISAKAEALSADADIQEHMDVFNELKEAFVEVIDWVDAHLSDQS